MLSFDQLTQNLIDTTQPNIVRSSAIAGLVTQGNPQSVQYLIDALVDSDAMIRREAAKALQHLEATRATEPLLRALQTESNDLTLWALLEAISELGTPSVLPTLESLLNIDSMLTRIEIKKSISRLQTRYVGEAAPTSPEISKEENKPSQTSTQSAPSSTKTSTKTEASDGTVIEKSEEMASDESTEPESEEVAKDESTEPEDVGEAEDETPLTDESDETEEMKAEDETPLTDESDETEDTESVASEPEMPQQEDDTDIKNLSDVIERSPRLAGSSVNLPVLVPNAATVPCHPNQTALEPTRANFFLALLHPNRYFSKRWISRTRAYLILWTVLLAGVIGFTQHQKHFGADAEAFPRMGLSADELPELVKRSLAAGDFYLQEGYYRKAIGAYELSRELGTFPTDFHRKLGFAYFKEGQYALAVEAYEAFLTARDNEVPDVFAAEASLVGVYPFTTIGEEVTRDYDIYNILGMAYAELGRVSDAQRAYEEAIHLAPKYGEAYNNLARLHANSYQQPLGMGLEDPAVSPKLKLAEALAYAAVTLNPDVAAYHDTLGWVLSKRGQVNKAMKTLERAINLQKDAVEPHYHLAHVALKANDRKKAAEAIRNVFKLKPTFVPLNTAKK